MNIFLFKRHFKEIKKGGMVVFKRKLLKAFETVLLIPFYILAVSIVIMVRLISPLFLLRLGCLHSDRIGHFAANTELYLCELDAGINKPKQRYFDIFYLKNQPVCNYQLLKMWRRKLNIWPAWIMGHIDMINRMIPGGNCHNPFFKNSPLDTYNLLDKFPSHLKFTDEENLKGKIGLNEMGIPEGNPFVCIIVRDNAYLRKQLPGRDWNYHNYRDNDIQNFVLAAEELAELGYFVIRMGAHVNEKIKSNHPRVIDYATNGMRIDFMDIFLGSNCKFCISTGLGWDAIPEMQRIPIVYVNFVPIGHIHTFRECFLSITKRHIFINSNKELTLQEIIASVSNSLESSDFESRGIRLVENTPEEIRDVVIEMEERLSGSWKEEENDGYLQELFWKIFPTQNLSSNGAPMHGEIRGRYGMKFLRQNPEWLSVS